MKTAIFYFSGTGNTQWAARKFTELLTLRGVDCSLVPIEQVPQNDAELVEAIHQSDFVCFFYPIYGADLPPILRRFLGRLTSLSAAWAPGKPACCVATFGYVNGFGPIKAHRMLASAGFSLKCHENVRLCNNLSTPLARTEPLPLEKLKRRREKAVVALDRAAGAMAAGKRQIRGFGPWLLAGYMIRKFTGPLIRQNHKSMGVELSLCKRCMLCVAQCPTSSIVWREDEGFDFLPTCTACSRCYNSCPSGAVTIGGVVADPEVYQRYTAMDN